MFIQEKTFSKTRTHAASADLPRELGDTSYALMEAPTQARGAMARDMDMARTFGLAGVDMWARGATTKSMGTARSPGSTGTATRARGATARNMDTARTPGLTGAATRVRGTRTPLGQGTFTDSTGWSSPAPRARSADGGRADRGHRAPLHCHIRRRLQDDGRSAHTCD